jgi:hypothetical protein
VEQELLTLLERLSSLLDFSGVRVTIFLVLCVCFVDHCLSFCCLYSGSVSCLGFHFIPVDIILFNIDRRT